MSLLLSNYRYEYDDVTSTRSHVCLSIRAITLRFNGAGGNGQARV